MLSCNRASPQKVGEGLFKEVSFSLKHKEEQGKEHFCKGNMILGGLKVGKVLKVLKKTDKQKRKAIVCRE